MYLTSPTNVHVLSHQEISGWSEILRSLSRCKRRPCIPCGNERCVTPRASRNATTTKFSKTLFMSNRNAEALVEPCRSSKEPERRMSFASFTAGR